MLVYHYTATIPECVEAKDQTASDGRKPIGFWVSDCDRGNGWREWCESEAWGLDGLKNRMLIDLDMKDILHLKSVSDIDAFSVDYKKVSYRLYPLNLIDWVAVAKEFSGILISPYQWERRLDGAASDWYYGWDCASGCVWSPKAVMGIEVDKNWQSKAA